MPKLLLVEDNEANRDMLSRRLVRHGFEVVFAVDGPSAVTRALREQPDLILMDVALGETMDGWQATLAIKAAKETARIPIIALTAHALESDRARSVEVGCCDFDTKPIDLPRLLGKINASLADLAAA
jgi:CheY-like chemotaxis protein